MIPSEPQTAAADVIGDELCRTSFGDFKESTLRQIAVRLVRKLRVAGFRIEREAQGIPLIDVELLYRAAREHIDGEGLIDVTDLPAIAAEYTRLSESSIPDFEICASCVGEGTLSGQANMVCPECNGRGIVSESSPVEEGAE